MAAAPMSALGHKRTFSDTLSNVRYWGQSGHTEVTVEVSPFECSRTEVKRTSQQRGFLFFYIAGFAPSPSALDPAFLRSTEILRI